VERDTPFDFAQGRLCPLPLTLIFLLTLTLIFEDSIGTDPCNTVEERRFSAA
jgi:hypothetical protein